MGRGVVAITLQKPTSDFGFGILGLRMWQLRIDFGLEVWRVGLLGSEIRDVGLGM